MRSSRFSIQKHAGTLSGSGQLAEFQCDVDCSRRFGVGGKTMRLSSDTESGLTFSTHLDHNNASLCTSFDIYTVLISDSSLLWMLCIKLNTLSSAEFVAASVVGGLVANQ